MSSVSIPEEVPKSKRPKGIRTHDNPVFLYCNNNAELRRKTSGSNLHVVGLS